MPEMTCTCGKRFTAARANAKYCSDRCRKRTKRAGADVVPLHTPEAADEVLAAQDGLGPIGAAALAELTRADRAETSLGLTAMALAGRLDRGTFETGSAYSALSKEFKATMAEATKGAGKATAPEVLADELAQRRASRGA